MSVYKLKLELEIDYERLTLKRENGSARSINDDVKLNIVELSEKIDDPNDNFSSCFGNTECQQVTFAERLEFIKQHLPDALELAICQIIGESEWGTKKIDKEAAKRYFDFYLDCQKNLQSKRRNKIVKPGRPRASETDSAIEFRNKCFAAFELLEARNANLNVRQLSLALYSRDDAVKYFTRERKKFGLTFTQILDNYQFEKTFRSF